MADNSGQIDTQKMREILLHKKREIIDRQHETVSSISGTDRRQDGFDVPFQSDETSVHVTQINSDKMQIKAIDKALDLIKMGEYGICKNCNHPIPPARLEAVPFAILCIECKSTEEKNGSTRKKR